MKRWLWLPLLLAPALVRAEMLASAEAFGTLSDHRIAGAKTDGNGYGLRGRVQIPGTGLYVRGEFIDESLDDGPDVRETRIGAGLSMSVTPLLRLDFEGQYADFETKQSGQRSVLDGGGLFVGAEAGLLLITAYARAGYLFLSESTDGSEILLGARASLLPLLGVFGEYRSLSLKADQGAKREVDGFRVGLRLSF